MDQQPANPMPENQPTPPAAQPAQPQPAPATPAAPTNPAPAPGSYISNPLELFKPSIAALKTNLGDLIGALLLGILLIGIFVGGIIYGASAHQAVISVVLGIVGLVVLFAWAPLLTLLLVAGAKGQKLGFGEALKRAPHFALSFFVLGFLTGLAVLGGLILLVIPGLIFATWFSLASYVLVDQDCGAIEAMKRSKALVKGHFWEMWGLFSVGMAAQVFNIIPFVGWLVTFVIGILYIAASPVRYLQLQELKSSNQPGPGIHWMNWVLMLVAVVAYGLSLSASLSRMKNLPTNNNPYQYNLPATNTGQ